MSIFQDCTLFISARSPFARRVRIAFKEHKINCHELLVNVFEHNPNLIQINPLGRVPAAKLKNGDVILDSNYILQALYLEQTRSTWKPYALNDRLIELNWSAMAVGISEKCVESFLETLRPASLQDASVQKDNKVEWERAMELADRRLEARPFLMGEIPHQCDIDWVCATEYSFS
jgi:glutathione S-transferase